MKRALVITTLIGALAFTACQQGGSSKDSVNLFPEAKGTTVIAEFDGIKITDEYLKAYIDQLNPYLKSRYNTPEKKEELVMKIIDGEILARQALKDGAISDAGLLTKIKSTIARYYAGEKLKAKIEEKIKLTDEDMKKYFEENKKNYVQSEKVKASHILIKAEKPEDKAKAMATAKKILAEVKAKANNPESFTELAKKYSEDEASKTRGGDVGYFERTEEGGKMVKEFTDASFALKNVGDVSDIVESSFGYHIIKLTGKREKIEKSFEDVKARIESTLKSEKRKSAYEGVVADIKKGMNFKFNKESLAKIDLSTPEDANKAPGAEGGMPGMPGNPGMPGMQGAPNAPKIDPAMLQEQLKKLQLNKANGAPQPGEAPAEKK